MSAAALVARLEGARRTADGRWIARCPAHDDKHPSLSVRDVGDGRTLVCCFAGCQTQAVLSALGLNWSALFPKQDRTAPPRKLRRATVATAADALRCLAHEARVLALLSGDLARGEALSEADRERLLLAAGRIAKAEALCLS